MFGNRKKTTATANALTGFISKFDVVGPTVDDDIRRAITRYGAQAVQAAVKSQTKAKKGRKPESDWPEMRELIERDAHEWLNGGDPFQTRKNYSIASEFSKLNPGQSAVSTHQRIERKLRKKPHDRLWFMLVCAKDISHESYSFREHIRTLEALAALPPENGGHEYFPLCLKLALNHLDDYRAKQGEYPPENMPMKQVEDIARNALIRENPPKGQGLGGLLAAYLPKETDNN